jgi:hypothetical protein
MGGGRIVLLSLKTRQNENFGMPKELMLALSICIRNCIAGYALSGVNPNSYTLLFILLCNGWEHYVPYRCL